MKNKRLQFALFSMLIVLSIGSFIYLNSLASPQQEVKCSETQMLEEEEQENSRIVLPDVELVKKLYRTGKRLLPASS